MSQSHAFLARMWLVVSILYGGLRVLVVWQFLSGYGVNPWTFALVEVFSSVIFGWSSGQTVVSLFRRKRGPLRWQVPLALVAYSAPDIFVFFSIRNVPRSLLIVIMSAVIASAMIAILSLYRIMQKAREQVTSHDIRSEMMESVR